MKVTFFLCEASMAPELEQLLDEMEAEDPLSEVEDSAYDRFAEVVEANHRRAIRLTREASEPAQAFYEWFRRDVSVDLDKLYLTQDEARRALDRLERRVETDGLHRLVAEFWPRGTHDELDAAVAYLETVRRSLEMTAIDGGVMVLSYR